MRDHTIDRRSFLGASVAAGVALAASRAVAGAEGQQEFTAAVIGHTGQGDYGHGLDVIFNGVPGVRVLAVADPDDAGRAKAAERTGAARRYGDYRQMLGKEKPQLVSIAPRWTDQHHAMALAALAAGAHLVMEKPIATMPAEADEILAAAEKSGRKIAVAHQMRLAPGVLHLKKQIDGGMIGDLLQLDAWGKQDGRAGGEDMMVLGVHLFDLMRFFAGDPRWCAARVLHQGRDVTASDARPAGEKIGPVGGDEIDATFGFDRGVIGTFRSRGRLRENVGHWGIEFTGSKGKARLLADIHPRVFVSSPAPWSDAGRTEQWKPLPLPAEYAGGGTDSASANRRIIDDWLDAIRQDRQPACSGHAAAKAVEMVMAVYHAALSGARVPFPLKDRRHPLAR